MLGYRLVLRYIRAALEMNNNMYASDQARYCTSRQVYHWFTEEYGAHSCRWTSSGATLVISRPDQMLSSTKNPV